MEFAMRKICLISVLSMAWAFGGEPKQVPAEMASAAQALLESLNEEQAKKATFSFDEDQRENWGFVPRERKGLALEELNEAQIVLVRGLLKTALSDLGLEKVDTIMALEAFLGEIEKRPDFRNPKAYFTSIFGTPKADGSWAWRFEGHHLSLNYTIIDGKKVTVTPSFFAANPGEVTVEHKMKGTRPLHAEEDLARALATILRESGKSVVFNESPPQEIFTAEDRAVKQLEPVGISFGEMTAAQQRVLRELIAEFANRHRKEQAKTDLALIFADQNSLRFGWAGGLKRGEPFYYRIQGTTFLVEVANVQNNGNHVHAVWRDQKNDFGRDLLGDHLTEDH